MKLLVTQIEQRQRPERSDTEFVLFGRSPGAPNERSRVVVRGFEPHFFAPRSEVDGREDYLLSQDCISAIGDECESLSGRATKRIETPYPQDTREAGELFARTWEADVPFTNRFRVDAGIFAYIEVPDREFSEGEAVVDYTEITTLEGGSGCVRGGGQGVEDRLQNLSPRTVTFDIEVDDRGDEFPSGGAERILSIVAHDSYSDEVVGFFDGRGRSVYDMFPDGAPDGVDELAVASSEGEMLDEFADYISDVDPDLLTGWNIDDFDAPYLLRRMERVSGVNPNELSPMDWAGVSRGEARIKGRAFFDLLRAYKRNQRTELRSYTLDNVAKAEVGASKVEFDGTYYGLYQNDPETFITYNARDVTLCVDINKEAGVIEFRDRLRRQVGVAFEDSIDPKDFVDIMCRGKLREWGVVGPTAPSFGDEPDGDFEGAYVLDPYEGVAENVVGMDLASLYPYTMAMLNASPETKVADKEGGVVAANGQHFSQDGDGLFREIVYEALGLKSDYKEILQSGSLEEEARDKAETDYAAAKVAVNAVYGVTGWERFFLYDRDVAEAITLTAQRVTKATAEFVRECGFEVLYGDTDSVYVKFPDEWSREDCLNRAASLASELNDEVYPDLATEFGIPAEESEWEIEVEAYMDRYFQAGKKKRYAYLATWKDGHPVEQPSPTVKGFSSKRSDSAALTVEIEEKIFEAILRGDTDDIQDIIFNAAQEIEPQAPDWERIGIPGGMGNKITDDPEQAQKENYYAVSQTAGEYHPQDAHPRASFNANQILGTQFGQGDKPMRIYLRPKYFEEVGRQIDTIAFLTNEDMEPVEGDVTVDTERMTDTIIKRPLREIVSAVGVDIDAAVSGQSQTGLGCFYK